MRCAANWRRQQCMICFAGKWSKVLFPFSVLTPVQSSLVKELWARVYFMWDCGTFWEALQKQSGFWGRGEDLVFKMEVRVRCLDVWTMIAATAHWVDSGIAQWDVQIFFWTSNLAVKGNREWIPGRKQERNLLTNLVEGLHGTAGLGVLTLRAE